MLKSSLFVDNDSAHTYTVAFTPTVLTICSQSFTDAHAPRWLKNAIHGKLRHTVIIFHHGSVAWFTLAAWGLVAPGERRVIVARFIVCGGGQLAESPET